MKGLQIAAGLAALASANSTPIYGKYPGWIQGRNKLGIQVQLYEDYLCSDSKRFNAVFEEVLAAEWLGSAVYDMIGVGLTPLPLPYHNHTYQVNQLVPYFMAQCDIGKTCLNNEYKDFAFDNLSTILHQKSDTSQTDFEAWWAAKVADHFQLDEADVASCYSQNDIYTTDSNLRAMWKYGTAKGVNATPLVFINGVKLDTVPMTV